MEFQVSDWLRNLKAGDEVALPTRMGRTYQVETVTRLTPTRILVGKFEAPYRKSDGRSIGTGVWDTCHIMPVTDEVREANALDKLHSRAVYLRDHLAITRDKVRLEKLIAALTPFVEAPHA